MDLLNNQNSKITIDFIGEIVKPDAAKTFIKRSFCVNITDELNGNVYNRKMALQVVGDTTKPAYDKTGLLDGLLPGDVVNVKYSIGGAVKKNEKLSVTPQNPLQLEGFNNLTATEITKLVVTQPQMGYPQAAGAYQPTPNYQPVAEPHNAAAAANNPGKPFHPQPGGEVPQDEKGNPKVWNTNTGVWENLPF